MMKKLKPSDYVESFPCLSVFGKTENESVALRIMELLEASGNRFRPVDWKEYVEFARGRGGCSEGDELYFHQVKDFCLDSERAGDFSKAWKNVSRMNSLDQSVFDRKPEKVVVACVDFDGLLKFGDDTHIRYTWASERWRGANWISEVKDTHYEPLTMVVRKLKSLREGD